MFNIPPSGPVQELLDRAGGRVELLVHFTTTKGYEVIDWNRPAAELFDLGVPKPGHPPLTWAEIPTALA